MSQTVFDENDFIKRVLKKILERTRENMEVYHMDLADSFQEATRELAKKVQLYGKHGIMMILENMYHVSMSRNIWILVNIH